MYWNLLDMNQQIPASSLHDNGACMMHVCMYAHVCACMCVHACAYVCACMQAHPSFLFILSIEQCVIAELKVALSVLQTAGDGSTVPLLKQPAVVQDQVVNVPPVLHPRLLRHYRSHDTSHGSHMTQQ